MTHFLRLTKYLTLLVHIFFYVLKLGSFVWHVSFVTKLNYFVREEEG